MKTKLLFITSIFLLIAGCNKGVDNYSGMNYEEICEEFDELAIIQKNLLTQVRNKYHSDKGFIAKFNQEQISWIQYQDKRLRALYTQDWDRFYRKIYGIPTFNGCKCKELIRLSKIRNEDLKVYLEGPGSSQIDCPIQGTEKGT